MNLRTRWASALTSTDLQHHPEAESAIDHIGAAAFGPRFGRMLWRIKYGGDLTLAFPAQRLLVRGLCRRWAIAKGDVRYVVVVRVAKQAMREWYSPTCRTCGGARETFVGELRVVCHVCDGSGQHAYSDRERRHAIMDRVGPNDTADWRAIVAARGPWEMWEPRLYEARSAVFGADAGTVMAMRQQLGDMED